jgi:hypothetical protein
MLTPPRHLIPPLVYPGVCVWRDANFKMPHRHLIPPMANPGIHDWRDANFKTSLHPFNPLEDSVAVLALPFSLLLSVGVTELMSCKEFLLEVHLNFSHFLHNASGREFPLTMRHHELHVKCYKMCLHLGIKNGGSLRASTCYDTEPLILRHGIYPKFLLISPQR